jgi:iron complex outermembrane receptor protein
MGARWRADLVFRRGAFRFRRCALAALLGLIAASARAGEPAAPPDPPDFTELSLEDLLKVKLVYAASRRAQSVGEAPSMVTVVGRDEIDRQGYRTLADLLRAVPGFYVATDHNYTYLGVRGFARPGDYNGRVLVLLNGVRINDNIYDGVLIGDDFVADLELVERVEIARGPAASLYGNNAFFAVVNVVTRKGSDLGRGELAASAGSFHEGRARAKWGGRVGAGLDVLASASTMSEEGDDLCFPEYAAEGGCAQGLNGETARRAYASAAWGGFQAQAAYSWRRKGIPTGAYDTVFGDSRNRTWDTLTRASLQYARSLGDADVALRLDHGYYRYTGHYVFADMPDSVAGDNATGRWWTVDGNAVFPLGQRHLLTAGAEAQWDRRMDQRVTSDTSSEPMLDVRAQGGRWGIYAQDDVRLSERLHVQLGARFDVSASRESRTSPRGSLVYSSPAGSMKLLYGRAFRAPNQYEQSYYAATGTLRAESIQTLELVAERNLGSRARVSAALFDNEISDLLTLEGEGHALAFRTAGRFASRGLELVGDWRGASGASARLSYTVQRTADASTALVLSNSPAHLAKASVEVPLSSRRIWLGSGLQYTSSRRTLGGTSLPGFAVADVALRASSLLPRVGLLLSVTNALDTTFAQPGSEEHRQDTIVQPGRAIRLEASWRF